MKKNLITIILFAAICFNCSKDAEIEKGFYDSLHFVRMGGGQIEFNLYPNENFDVINAEIIKIGSIDTAIQVIIDDSNDYELTFSALNKAMNNQTQINGDFQQQTLPAGTWFYIYLIKNGHETEITNTELRNSLQSFEQILQEKIQ